MVDESNPALQGFLSWDLWRRHKGDANGQYWLGAVRDREDPKNWKWVTGNPVTVSFWNLPGGNDDCARFDGTKGWLWSDTNCGLKLNFICQHRECICPLSISEIPSGIKVCMKCKQALTVLKLPDINPILGIIIFTYGRLGNCVSAYICSRVME